MDVSYASTPHETPSTVSYLSIVAQRNLGHGLAKVCHMGHLITLNEKGLLPAADIRILNGTALEYWGRRQGNLAYCGSLATYSEIVLRTR